MKCSNEISCHGSYDDYHFKVSKEYCQFLNGFIWIAQIDKPNETEKSLVYDVHFSAS